MVKRKREAGEQMTVDAAQAKRKREARDQPKPAAAKAKREREAGEQPMAAAAEAKLKQEAREQPKAASAEGKQNLDSEEHPASAAASAASNRRLEAAKRIAQKLIIHRKRMGRTLRKIRTKKTESAIGYGRHCPDPDDWIEFPSFELGNVGKKSLLKHQPAGFFLRQPAGFFLKDPASGKKQHGTAKQLETAKKTPSRRKIGVKWSPKQTDSLKKSANETFFPITKKVKLNGTTKIDPLVGLETPSRRKISAKWSPKKTESSKKSVNETFFPMTKKVKLNGATKNDPLVGLKKSLSSFAEEFEGGNLIVLKQIKQLSEKYVAIRQIRADGNCYFRSFVFSYLENLILNQDYTEAARFTARIEEAKLTLAEFNTSDAVKHHHQALCTLLKDVFPGLYNLFRNKQQNKSGHSTFFSHEILTRMSPEISDHVVSYLRLITSAEIRRRVKFFKPFVFHHSSVEEFCKDMVEPMGKECMFVQMTALSDALGIPVRVVFIDQTPPKSIDGIFYHDFIPSQVAKDNGEPDSGKAKPLVTLLALPGHFHILYCK